MRPFREYVPDQAYLALPSPANLIPEGDPVFYPRDEHGVAAALGAIAR